jgi:hypothetical protein
MLIDLQYYKPWELLPEHENQIKRQIEEAQATINDELDELERRRGEEALLEAPAPAKIKDETMGDAPNIAPPEPREEIAEAKDGEVEVSILTTEQPDQAAREQEPEHEPEQTIEEQPATAGAEAVTKAEEEAEIIDEHHGEMVVEAEEDTVIY